MRCVCPPLHTPDESPGGSKDSDGRANDRNDRRCRSDAVQANGTRDRQGRSAFSGPKVTRRWKYSTTNSVNGTCNSWSPGEENRIGQHGGNDPGGRRIHRRATPGAPLRREDLRMLNQHQGRPQGGIRREFVCRARLQGRDGRPSDGTGRRRIQHQASCRGEPSARARAVAGPGRWSSGVRSILLIAPTRWRRQQSRRPESQSRRAGPRWYFHVSSWLSFNSATAMSVERGERQPCQPETRFHPSKMWPRPSEAWNSADIGRILQASEINY